MMKLTRQQADALFTAACEAEETHPASDQLRAAYESHRDAEERYIAALQLDTFIWAYELGYRHATEVMKKGGATV